MSLKNDCPSNQYVNSRLFHLITFVSLKSAMRRSTQKNKEIEKNSKEKMEIEKNFDFFFCYFCLKNILLHVFQGFGSFGKKMKMFFLLYFFSYF